MQHGVTYFFLRASTRAIFVKSLPSISLLNVSISSGAINRFGGLGAAAPSVALLDFPPIFGTTPLEAFGRAESGRRGGFIMLVIVWSAAGSLLEAEGISGAQ